MWLGTLFAESGCQAIPALHCRQALTLVQRVDLPISILIVDPELRGAGRMVQVVMAANPGLRLVLIRDAGTSKSCAQENLGSIQTRFSLERPAAGEEISREEWVAKVRKVLI
jgi:hypothetical protein